MNDFLCAQSGLFDKHKKSAIIVTQNKNALNCGNNGGIKMFDNNFLDNITEKEFAEAVREANETAERELAHLSEEDKRQLDHWASQTKI